MLFSIVLNLTKLSLGLVMIDQLNISFSIKDEFLPVCLFVLILFYGPLFLKHFLLDLLFSHILLALHLLGMILPRQNIERFLYLFFLFHSFSFFSSDLFLCIEHPKFCINLFFNNLLLHFLSLVHKLLFSLKLCTSCHKMSLLSS